MLAGADANVRGVDSGDVKGDLSCIAKDFADETGITIGCKRRHRYCERWAPYHQHRKRAPMMGRISGTGCMATSIIASFAAVHPDMAEASAASLAAFGIAGERAAAVSSGPGSFKVALFDQLSLLTPADLARDAKIREL